MRKLTLLAALAAATAISSPAMAGSADGNWQVKVLGTGILPDGKISKVYNNAAGVPADTQTKANDNVVPTVAIEYFVLPNMSIETICCVTQHDVDGTAGLPGAELVSDAKLIPATFTAKFHLPTGTGLKPYAGVGAAYFIWFDEKPGAATLPLGVNDFDMSNEFGFALQAGLDYSLGDSGFGVTVDAKKYFIDTKARWFIDGTEVLKTKHKLDPWVISAGVSYRF